MDYKTQFVVFKLMSKWITKHCYLLFSNYLLDVEGALSNAHVFEKPLR